MKTIIITAWRNVWRNKMRSAVIITAVSIGIFGGLFASGVMKGWIKQRMNDAINYEVSHIQIHHPKFSENNEFKYQIGDLQKLELVLDSISEIKSFSKRVKLNAVAQSINSGGNPIELVGIIPSEEKKVSKLNDRIVDSTGSYVKNNDYRKIFIGYELAKNLKIVNYKFDKISLEKLRSKTESEIYDTIRKYKNKRFTSKIKLEEFLKQKIGEEKTKAHLAQIAEITKYYRTRARISINSTDPNGNIIGNRFRIQGIYRTNNSSFDNSKVFLSKKAMNQFLGTNNLPVHEIAIYLNNNEDTKKVKEILEKQFPKLQIESWKELDPAVGMQSEYIGIMNYYLMFFILFALAFGIINTMLMAILERTKEIGMLMAIGMNKAKLFSMIMFETIFLTGSGAILGIFIGISSLSYFAKKGINLSMFQEGFEAMGFASKIYPESDIRFFFGTIILVIIVSIFASVYPAIKAMRLNPANAIRTE